MKSVVSERNHLRHECVNIGLIGAGYWGKGLVHEYLELERDKRNLRLAKICDSSLPTLLACEKEYSISYRLLTQKVLDIIGDPNISAVHIATAAQTHYSLAKLALEAGKHVLVENPLAHRSDEARELVELAASRELVLQVRHVCRFSSMLQAARQAIRSGMLGKIFYARVQWAEEKPPFADRDIIFDLGCYPIDTLNMLLDAWPSRASGFARAYLDSRDHEDVAFVTTEFPERIVASIELSWLDPSEQRGVTIVGSEGALIIDCLNRRMSQIRNGDSVELPTPDNTMSESEIDHFISRINRPTTSSESAPIDLTTVQVLEAMRRSVEGGSISAGQSVNHAAAITRILEMAGDEEQDRLSSFVDGNASFERYAGMLVKSGFLRPVLSQEGKRYEITESGSLFLKEYQDLDRCLDGTRSSPRESNLTNKSRA